MSIKGKVLCLHGFVQSGDIFKLKSSGLRKSLKKIGLETCYLTAPIKIVPADLPFDLSEEDLQKRYGAGGDDKEYRGWWVRNKPDYDIEETLESIKSCVEKEGPFVGLIGFSQGAGLAAMISPNFSQLFGQSDPLKFAIFYSGFKVVDNPVLDKYYKTKISIPTLHVIGELDTVVTNERSMRLYDECCEPKSATILKHPGGHFVPNARNIVDKEIAWLQNVFEDKPAVEEPKKEDDLDDILAMIDNLGKA